MPGLQGKSFRNPDETRTFEKGRVDIVTMGEISIARTTAEPGWKWSEHIRPLAGTLSCQIHHLGVVTGGRVKITMDDGTTREFGPDETYDIPPGHDAAVVGEEVAVLVDYAGGMGTFAKPSVRAADRILTTLVFTDIVGSTRLVEQLGDERWKELLGRHNEEVRRQIDRHRGREVATTGDGFLATFDGAARAVECAAAICRAVESLGLAVRTGVHTGEVEVVAGNVRGTAVHAAARIAARAQPGEVLVSATTRELLAGSGLEFEDRGLHELQGLSGARQLFRSVAAAEPATVGDSDGTR